MPRKKDQGEEILKFAMKVVGPVAAVFVAAIMIDIADLRASFDSNVFLSEIGYRLDSLF